MTPTPHMPTEDQSTQEPKPTPPTDSSEHTEHGKKYWSKIKYIWPIPIVLFAIVVICLVLRIETVATHVSEFTSIFSPVIIGCIIAYLCNPILKFYEHTVFHRMKKSSARRAISMTMTFATALVVVLVVVLLILPQLINSLLDLWNHRAEYINSLSAFLNRLIYSNEHITEAIQSLINKLEHSGQDDTAHLIEDYINPEKLTELNNRAFTYLMVNIFHIGDFGQMGSDGTQILGTLWDSVLNVVGLLKNFLLGLFIAIYILASKEKRIAQFNKFCKAIFTDKQNNSIHEFTELTNRCFGGFIYGKIIDSIVIGLMTFLILTIFEISPYNLLIAAIIGVTNVIPVFGPFIGAVPAFFIVLISNPSKAIFLLILILIIQQVDGNIIGPKILGDNTGVSSLSIIIAITIASGLWGIWGMIIGVPIVAVIIEAVKRFLERRLEAKGEPTSTTAYYPADAVGDAEKDVYYEHSGLLYRYEHSKIKPWFERLVAKFYRRPYEPDVAETDKSSTEENRTDDTSDNS